MTLVTQCYTNRAVCWHKLGNHKRALEDASYVLDYIDSKNLKAIFRRAAANKALKNYE